MSSNVGATIKLLATILGVITAISFIMLGLADLINTGSAFSALFLFIGPFMAWASALLLYGFGQLIENSQNSLELQRQIIALMTTESSAQDSTETSTQDYAQDSVKISAYAQINNEPWTCFACRNRNYGTEQTCSTCRTHRLWSDARWKEQ